MQYTEGYLLDGRYQLERFIGSGSFGEVWVATDKATDLEVATKIYVAMDEKGLQDFKKEFQLSFELNHSNLLHANYLGVNQEDRRPYLVMPYCPEGAVTRFAGKMSSPGHQARQYPHSPEWRLCHYGFRHQQATPRILAEKCHELEFCWRHLVYGPRAFQQAVSGGQS